MSGPSGTVSVRRTPIPLATVDGTQGSDSAPIAHDNTLPAGVTSSGCMVGTRGHSLVMVYTENPYEPTSDCRSVAKGDYLYTKAPDLSRLVRYCSATKNDSTVTLDIYDTPNDLALSKYPEIGTAANAICVVFQGNTQWTVDRNMSLVPTYVSGSLPIDATTTPTSAARSGSFFLDNSGPQYAPTGNRLSCATVGSPAAVVTVFRSDTSAPAPDCTSLRKDFSWADPSVPNHTLVCTADNLYETAKVYTALGSDDYSKLLCQTFAQAGNGMTVTYP